MTCRVCGSESFEPLLDLGMHAPADAFLTAAQLSEPEVTYPLRVVVCDRCDLVQLDYVVPRGQLYGADYPYVSNTTATGVTHYHEMARTIAQRFPSGGYAVDIGSNVGVLLSGFRALGMGVIGIEPVPRIAALANVNGIETVTAFFSAMLATELVQARGQAAYVTGTNVVAHIDDVQDLARGIVRLIGDRGVFVFEAPYLVDLVARLEYDTIYHEHLSYLAVRPVDRLFRQHGLRVFDVEHVPIHGGSLRYYIGSDHYLVSSAVRRAMELEEAICGRAALRQFAYRVQGHRSDLHWLISGICREGKTVAAVSAPAKGMTLVNYCHLGPWLAFATEKAETKIGRFTPGTRIPVVSDYELIRQRPDYALLLAWNFAAEIIDNLQDYVRAGGKFIVPIPAPRVVTQAHQVEQVAV